jgi:hypothetical protein
MELYALFRLLNLQRLEWGDNDYHSIRAVRRCQSYGLEDERFAGTSVGNNDGVLPCTDGSSCFDLEWAGSVSEFSIDDIGQRRGVEFRHH